MSSRPRCLCENQNSKWHRIWSPPQRTNPLGRVLILAVVLILVRHSPQRSGTGLTIGWVNFSAMAFSTAALEAALEKNNQFDTESEVA